MILLNIFGAPSSGKSTLALLVAGILKSRYSYLTVECPNEVAKMIVYDDARKALDCQIYVAGRQTWQIDRCRDHADIVVCDSPILLSWVYGNEGGRAVPDTFFDVLKHYHDQHDSLNVVVRRPEGARFENKARVHSQSDEDRIHDAILDTLCAASVPHINVQPSPEHAEALAWRLAEMHANKNGRKRD